uniref:Extended FMRFamide-12 n=1 Tax=Pachyphasma brandbergense TaxID=1041430 RepID=FAR12_PACBA|nr:RecName: Full=Extended FMRFamide-12; Short=FMRFa-12 [Pachyphasma brandbergense]
SPALADEHNDNFLRF